MLTSNFARPESQFAFSSQEEEAYFAANEVQELELEQFVGIACSFVLGMDNKKVGYWMTPEAECMAYCKGRFIIVDRRQLGSKSSRRFQITTCDHNQHVVKLCRSLEEVKEFIIAN
jgi:hypothetical protein